MAQAMLILLIVLVLTSLSSNLAVWLLYASSRSKQTKRPAVTPATITQPPVEVDGVVRGEGRTVKSVTYLTQKHEDSILEKSMQQASELEDW